MQGRASKLSETEYRLAIYKAAIEKDVLTLREIFNGDHRSNPRARWYGEAIYVLARDGERDAIHFLIDHYEADRNRAACGFAREGYEALVDELIDISDNAGKISEINMHDVAAEYVSEKHFIAAVRMYKHGLVESDFIIGRMLDYGYRSEAKAVRDAIQAVDAMYLLSKFADRYLDPAREKNPHQKDKYNMLTKTLNTIEDRNNPKFILSAHKAGVFTSHMNRALRVKAVVHDNRNKPKV